MLGSVPSLILKVVEDKTALLGLSEFKSIRHPKKNQQTLLYSRGNWSGSMISTIVDVAVAEAIPKGCTQTTGMHSRHAPVAMYVIGFRKERVTPNQAIGFET